MPTTDLQVQLSASVVRVRGAMIDLLGSVGGDPHKPQDVARRFGIDKSLAWKISRVVKALEPDTALVHVPGNAGLDIFLTAMERAGAAKRTLARARKAIEDFQKVVKRHVGDRPTLELVLDALPSQRKDRLAVSRKLAFRGNSGIWGIQARVRVQAMIIAPNADQPDMVDSVLVGGWIDVRRLRPDAEWTIFRRRAYRGGQSVSSEEVPLDPDESAGGLMLLKDFCTALPPITANEDDGSVVYELGPGPVGNTGGFTCFFGYLNRKLGSRFGEGADDAAESHAMISAPVKTLMFDLIAHHSLQIALHSRLRVYGTVASDLWARKKRDVLPIEADVQQLGARPPVLSTPLVKDYPRMIEHVCARVGWNLADFVGIRFELEHPPFPSTVAVRVPLEVRPR